MIAKFLIGFGVLISLGWLWIAAAPSDPGRWHRDPLDGDSTGRPNEYRIAPPDAPVFAVTPLDLARRIDAIARAEPHTRRLAGAPENGLTTYLQRSAVMKFPDYISVRVVEHEDGATVAIWSRSRFGYGDLGVNEARVVRWLNGAHP